MDAFRQLEIDKMYRLGIMDENDVMNATDCRVSCLAVRTRNPEGISRSCVRCGSASPERRHRKVVASLDTELQNAYDNGRFSSYRRRYAPLFVSVSCFPLGHTTVRVTASGSDAKMWSCIRCSGGTVYSVPEETPDEDRHYDKLMPLSREFKGVSCVECGARQECSEACPNCGNASRTYEKVKAVFLRR